MTTDRTIRQDKAAEVVAATLRAQQSKPVPDAEKLNLIRARCQSVAESHGDPHDERDRRLLIAEEILSDLATGYWVAVLDAHDNPVKEPMGQRVLAYWRACDEQQKP